MEKKENVNPTGGDSNILMPGFGPAKGSLANIDHSVSLEELFKEQIKCGINAFKAEGKMMPAAFLVCRDFEQEKYKIAIYPMPNPGPGAMEFHSMILKRLISQMKQSEMNTFKLVGVIIGMDAYMSQVPIEQALNSDGSINKDNYVPPSQDPQAKDVLHFSLEDSFGKHIIAYEYITASDGTAVVNETPFIDKKEPYNERANNNSNFGFFFAEKIAQN
jgi:hypothetical protein